MNNSKPSSWGEYETFAEAHEAAKANWKAADSALVRAHFDEMDRQYPLKFLKKERVHLDSVCTEVALRNDVNPHDLLRLAQFQIRGERRVSILIHTDAYRFFDRVGLTDTVRGELYDTLRKRGLLLKTA